MKDSGSPAVDWNTPHARRFREAMDDDFRTPEAVAVLFELAHEIGRGRRELAPQLRALGGVLGLLQRDAGEFLRGGPAEDWIAGRIAAREAARKRKDFAAADDIRRELLEKGIVLEDSPGERHGGGHKGTRASLVVRVTHWINVVAVLLMIASGWRIYNADPIFDFSFPDELTLGGWLAGALQWHFAAMWLLVLNGLVYVCYGIISGHFRRKLLRSRPVRCCAMCAMRCAGGSRMTICRSTTPRSARRISR